MLALRLNRPMNGCRLLLALTLVSLAQPPGLARQTPEARSPRNASYVLDATLDPAARTITGAGTLTWRNVSGVDATELRFHLYWNAWRNADSSWMREQWLGRNALLARRPAGDWGWIDMTALALRTPDGAADLLGRARFISPDDGNPEDRTVLSAPLDRAVRPGETVTIDLGWTTRVPRTFARTGAIGDYFFIAQWFPKIGVLEPGGWNARQFHGATEFFADFGSYDVSLTVPEGWVVGATGRQMSITSLGDGRATHRYAEDDVHDFAWTTSPDFVEVVEPFDEPGLPPVRIRLLLQPEHRDQADRHITAARAALRHYGTWFGPYPYAQITVVDPVAIVNARAQGEGTGGMEYPTLFTAGTRWRAPARGTQPESVTIHEAGHQFWYGIVATNEFEHAWLDEGLNTFSTARVLEEAYPEGFVAVERYFGGLVGWPYDGVRWSRAVDGNRLNAYRPVARHEVQATPTWQYWPGSASAITYNKTSLWLATLERHLGWDTVQRILSTWFARGAFRHPAPEEFFAIANEASGEDLSPFFDAVHRGEGVFDYAVAQVTSVPAEGAGWVGEGRDKTFRPGGGPERDHLIIIRRHGDGVFPVDVRTTFDDGTSDTVRWDGRALWTSLTYRLAAGVVRVDVDPDRVLLLDVNYTNNSWTAAPDGPRAARTWSLRWLTWLEEVLLTYAVFV
jgi:hypothetical protein